MSMFRSRVHLIIAVGQDRACGDGKDRGGREASREGERGREGVREALSKILL